MSFPEIDLSLQPIKPQIYLCKPNRTTIAKINNYTQCNHSYKFAQINELTISIPVMVDINHVLQKNNIVDKLKQRYLIRVEKGYNIEWYLIIGITDSGDSDTETKLITAYSLGYELADKYISVYQEDSKNMTQILTDVLYESIWSVGEIEDQFNEKYRSFNFSSQTVLDCVFEIATTFNAIVDFDTINRKINMYTEDNVGFNKGLRLRYGDYIQTLSKEERSEEMVTRLKAFGQNQLSIQRLNPTGTNYIESFNYFIYPFERDESGNIIKHSDYLTDELCVAISNYESLIETKKTDFNTYLTQKTTLETNLTTKENELTTLNEELSVIEDNLDIAQAAGQDTTELLAQKDLKESEIETKQTEIDNINADIASITINITVNTGATTNSGDIVISIDGIDFKVPVTLADDINTVAQKIYNLFNNEVYYLSNDIDQSLFMFSSYTNNVVTITYQTSKDNLDVPTIFVDLNTTGTLLDFTKSNRGINNSISVLRKELAIENNFTPEQITERNQFIIEKEWVDSRYIDDEDLYIGVQKKFEEMRMPKTVFSIDIINFLNVIEEQKNWDKLNLGDFVTIIYDRFDINIIARIIQIDYDYFGDTITLTIANVKDLLNEEEELIKLLYQSSSTSATVDMSKYKWDKTENNETEISKVIDILQGNSKEEISLSANETVTINSRGITVQDPSDPLKFLRITHGVLGISQTGGRTYDHCISTEGIIGERIFGKLGTFCQVRADQIIVGDSGEQLPNEVIDADTWINKNTAYNNVTITQENGIVVKDNSQNEVLKMGSFDSDNDGIKDKYGFRASHTDGSYTQMSSDGFERVVAKPIMGSVPTGVSNSFDCYTLPPSTSEIIGKWIHSGALELTSDDYSTIRETIYLHSDPTITWTQSSSTTLTSSDITIDPSKLFGKVYVPSTYYLRCYFYDSNNTQTYIDDGTSSVIIPTGTVRAIIIVLKNPIGTDIVLDTDLSLAKPRLRYYDIYWYSRITFADAGVSTISTIQEITGDCSMTFKVKPKWGGGNNHVNFFIDGIQKMALNYDASLGGDAEQWYNYSFSVTKGVHSFLWKAESDNANSDSGLYLNDIVFESNQVEWYETSTVEVQKPYSYMFYSDTVATGAGTMYREVDGLGLDCIPPKIVELPTEFRGKEFKVTLSFAGTVSEGNFGTGIGRVYLKVIDVDYEKGRFTVLGYQVAFDTDLFTYATDIYFTYFVTA